MFLKRTYRSICKSLEKPVLPLALLTLWVLLSSGCGAETRGHEAPDEIAIDTKTPTFEEIQLLMKIKCQNCHSTTPGKFAPANTPPIALDNEEEFTKRLSSTRNRVFFTPDNPMPPDYGTPLTDREKEALKKYIDTLEAQTSDDTPIETNLLFADVSTALAEKCGVCHSSTAKISPPELDDLEDYKNSRSSVLSSIENERMPKNTTGFKETVEGRNILDWLKGGKDVFPQEESN